MLGHDLVTKQTGPAGRTVKRLYIEEGCEIKRELYLGCWSTARPVRSRRRLDRRRHGHREGRARNARKIVKQPIDPASACQAFDGRRSPMARPHGKQVGRFVGCLGALYKAFIELDAR